jgi:hypothetical protein
MLRIKLTGSFERKIHNILYDKAYKQREMEVKVFYEIEESISNLANHLYNNYITHENK